MQLSPSHRPWILPVLAVLLGGCGAWVDLTPPPEPSADGASAPDASPPDASAQTHPQQALWSRLQQAEEEILVVLLRHALAPGTGDPASFELGDCSTQRNLSAAGRQQAQAIGEAFRDRNIPIQQVLSSQWCRCLDTAKLMDLAPVQPFAPLNSFFGDRSTADAQTQQVQDYLARAPVESGVIVMVTHQVNITALSGVTPGSGEAVVVAPIEGGELSVLGRLLGD